MKMHKIIFLLLTAASLLFFSCENSLADYLNNSIEGFEKPLSSTSGLYFENNDGNLTINAYERTRIPDYKEYAKTPWSDETYSSVTIGENITSIGNNAFGDINNSNPNKIKNVSILGSVTKIGDNAFYDSDITEITIPSSVESIGKSAFEYCEQLTEVDFVSGSVILKISDNAFHACKNLNKIKTKDSSGNEYDKFPENLSSIGNNAFNETNLNRIELPVSFDLENNLPENAFEENTIIFVTFRDDTTQEQKHKIKELLEDKGYSFEENEQGEISTVISDTIVGSNTYITWAYYESYGEDYNCLVFEGYGEIPDYQSGENRPWDDSRIYYYTIRISNGITRIGDRAFKCRYEDNIPYSDMLQKVYLPESLEEIGSYAFEANNSLKSINFNDKLNTIGAWAFSGTDIYSVTIPSSVETIDYYAFNVNTNITVVGKQSESNLRIMNADEYFVSYTEKETSGGYDHGGDDDHDGGDDPSSKVYGGPAGDNISWRLENNVLTLTGYGEMYDYDNPGNNASNSPSRPGWDSYSFNTVIIDPNITTVGSYAFSNYIFSGEERITSVSIPSSITKIKEGAFINNACLTMVRLPNNLSEIGSYAFMNCGLTQIEIPASVYKIGDSAFDSGITLDVYWSESDLSHPDLHNLLYKVIYHEEERINNWAGVSITWEIKGNVLTFTGNGEMYDYLLDGNDFAPWLNSSLSFTEVVFDDNITKIGKNAFNNTYGYSSDAIVIKKVTLPSSLTVIGSNAFNGNDSLTQITLPQSLQYIYYGAFYNCGLTSVTIPHSVIYLDENCFDYDVSVNLDWTRYEGKYCYMGLYDSGNIYYKDPEGSLGDNMSWVMTPDQTLTIKGTGSMIDFSYNNPAPWADLPFFTVNIEEGITSIGAYAFYNCTNMNTVNFASTITAIGNSAFAGCYSIQKIELPQSLKEIGNSAFNGVKNYSKRLKIPASVETIGEAAFYDASVVELIFEENSKCTTIKNNAFNVPDDYYYSMLSAVRIPSSVTSIEKNAFPTVCQVSVDWYEGESEGHSVDSTINVIFKANEEFEFNDGILTINGDVNKLFFNVNSTINPNLVTQVIIGKNTRVIASETFKGCSLLTTVQLAEEEGDFLLTKIGSHAFAGCSNIETVALPDSVTVIENNAFSGCSSLTEINLPSALTSIGEYAFCGCTSLVNVDFTNCSNLEIVGQKAFGDCSSLSSIDLSSCLQITSIEKGTFEICLQLQAVQLPSGINSIGEEAFYQCGALSSVSLNNCTSLTTIGEFAFCCSGLTTIDLSSCQKLESIGVYAFNSCDSLSSVSLDNCASLTTIGESAFGDCSSLSSVSLNNCTSLTTIENNAFYGSGLTTIDLSSCHKLESIGGYAFQYCSSLSSVSLDNCTSLTTIGEYAFYCSGLTTIDLSSCSSLTTIENNAFYASSLTTIDLSGCSSLTTIGEYAFYSSGLTTIDLSSCQKLESIGGYAFQYCSSLSSVSLNNCTSLTTIGEYAFYSSGLTTIDLSDCTSLNTIDYQAFNSQTAIIVDWKKNDANHQNVFADSDISDGRYVIYYICTEFDESTGAITFADTDIVDSVVLSKFYNDTGKNMYDIKKVIIGPGVKQIGVNTFEGFTNITSVTCSSDSQLERVGENAFKDCTSLQSAQLPDTVTYIGFAAFSGCTALTEFTVPENLEYIVGETFKDTALSSIIIPEKVRQIDGYAFAGSLIKRVYIPDTVDYIQSFAFNTGTVICAGWSSEERTGVILNSDEYTILYYGEMGYELTDDGTLTVYGVGESVMPDYTTTNKAPWGNSSSSISKVIIAEGMTSIGTYAFYNYTKLESVTMSDSVKSIADHAFYCCKNLKEVILSSSVETIDNYAFAGTSNNNLASFKEVIIPASVVTIGQYAFQYCSGLETVTFEENSKLESLKTGVFNYCSGLGEIEIPASVNFIGQNLFSGCTSLKKVVFAEGSLVEEFNGNTFYNCTSLEEVTLPSGLTKLSTYTFQNCTSLARLDLPAGINHSDGIGAGCFSGWTSGQVIVADWNSSENKVGSNYLGSATVLYKDTVEKTVKYFVNNSEQETITTTYNYFDKNKSLYEVKNSDGKKFLGWYKEPAFNTRVTAVSELFDAATVDTVQSVNLYALWAETYTMPESQSGTATGGDGTEPEYTDMTFTETSRLKVFILSNVKAGSKYSFNFNTYTTNPLQVPYYYEHLIIDDFNGVYAGSLQVQSINTLETSTVTGTAQEGMSWLLFVGAPEAEYFGENTKIGLLVKKIQ